MLQMLFVVLENLIRASLVINKAIFIYISSNSEVGHGFNGGRCLGHIPQGKDWFFSLKSLTTSKVITMFVHPSQHDKHIWTHVHPYVTSV
jgi:hypothetical protein